MRWAWCPFALRCTHRGQRPWGWVRTIQPSCGSGELLRGTQVVWKPSASGQAPIPACSLWRCAVCRPPRRPPRRPRHSAPAPPARARPRCHLPLPPPPPQPPARAGYKKRRRRSRAAYVGGGRSGRQRWWDTPARRHEVASGSAAGGARWERRAEAAGGAAGAFPLPSAGVEGDAGRGCVWGGG